MGLPAVAVYRLAVRARDKAFSLLARSSFASFGRRSVVQLPVRLAGEGRIAIGDDVFVGAGSWLQVLDGPDPSVALTSVCDESARRVTIASEVGEPLSRLPALESALPPDG